MATALGPLGDDCGPEGGLITVEDTRATSALEGEWECDACGYIIPGRANKPPEGPCRGCGESADNSFTFYSYDEGWYEGWDDDIEDEEYDDEE